MVLSYAKHFAATCDAITKRWHLPRERLSAAFAQVFLDNTNRYYLRRPRVKSNEKSSLSIIRPSLCYGIRENPFIRERGTLHPLTTLATWDVASLNRLAISDYKEKSALRYGFGNLCLGSVLPSFRAPINYTPIAGIVKSSCQVVLDKIIFDSK